MIQQQQPRQGILLILLIISVGFVAGYIYYSQFAPGTVVPVSSSGGDEGIKKYKDLDIDFKVLDNQEYKSLKIFGDAPVVPDSSGKKNFFGPSTN
jgi:hypothetical protein